MTDVYVFGEGNVANALARDLVNSCDCQRHPIGGNRFLHKSTKHGEIVFIAASYSDESYAENTAAIELLINRSNPNAIFVILSTLSRPLISDRKYLYVPIFESEPFLSGVFRPSQPFAKSSPEIDFETTTIIANLTKIDEFRVVPIEELIFSKIALNVYLASVASVTHQIFLTTKGAKFDTQQVWEVLNSDSRFANALDSTLPSLGVGGMCMKHSLTAFSEQHNNELERFVKNTSKKMFQFFFAKVNKHFASHESIAILGVGFKRGSTNPTNSPRCRLAEHLKTIFKVTQLATLEEFIKLDLEPNTGVLNLDPTLFPESTVTSLLPCRNTYLSLELS